MASRLQSMSKTLKAIFNDSLIVLSRGAIERLRFGEFTFRKDLQ